MAHAADHRSIDTSNEFRRGSGGGPVEGDVHRTSIDWDQQEPVTEAVVGAIAALEDCPPTELDPLYRYVEPDALNRLFEHARSGAEGLLDAVAFTIDDYAVTVRGDGDVVVEVTG